MPRKSGPGDFPSGAAAITGKIVMVLALESPRPFSFRAPVVPAVVRPLQAHRPLAARQADRRHLVLFVWPRALLADRPHQPLLARPALAAWSALVH
jgi:hypothetical protein